MVLLGDRSLLGGLDEREDGRGGLGADLDPVLVTFAVEDDLLAAEAGAHEAHLLAGSDVEAGDDETDRQAAVLHGFGFVMVDRYDPDFGLVYKLLMQSVPN